MGGVGVRSALAHLLVAAGGVLVAVAVFLLLGVAFALLVAGVLVAAYGLLLVEVPTRTEVEVSPGPGDLTRVGR